jgi:anti-sigma factor RsiW
VISCHKVLENLSDYIDDSAADEVRRELESHIAGCRSCQVVLDTSRRTLRIVTDVGSFEIPAEVSKRLLQKTLRSLGGGSGDDPAGK